MAESRREPLLTAPLLVFLITVAGLIGYGLTTRFPSPDAAGAIVMLADGDLDGDERKRMLGRVLEFAEASDAPPRQLWAGLLAAVALERRDAFAALERRLPAGRGRVLDPDERRDLGLGDPLLANVLRALQAEAAGDAELAATTWGQVAAQARLTANRFAAELAASRRG